VSVTTPTTQALSDSIIAQLEGTLGASIPLLPKSFSRVLAKVVAAAIVIDYKYAGFALLQMFVAHASARETEVNGKKIIPLVELGRQFGVGDPNAATQAEHVMAVTVLNQTGSLPIGSTLVDTDSGVIFQTTAAIFLDAAVVNPTVRAVSDSDGGDGSGDIGNLEPGDTLSFANTPANVATDATVVSTTVTGADAEDPEVYRARVLRRIQARPQGGAYADYVAWSTEVEGIAAAYPYTGDNPGEVDIYVEATAESSGSEDGIPTAAQLTAVADSINFNIDGLASRRPVGAAINVLPITRTAFDVTIVGLLPDSPDTRDEIEDGLDELLRNRKPYIEGLSVLPREDRITSGALAGTAHEIAAAEGASITDVETTPNPLSYSLGHGELAKLGTVTWE
jgi:uncharacterized phage protein gp47/JayE